MGGVGTRLNRGTLIGEGLAPSPLQDDLGRDSPSLGRLGTDKRVRSGYMSWFFLLLAGLLEVGWAYGLKLSNGFSKPVPSLVTVFLMIGSFLLLSLALKRLPMSTAYAVWTGIGVVGTALVGVTVLGEPRDFAKLLCIALITTRIIGLKLVS